MKLYLFFALSIFGMGGGQVYLFRKKTWLESQGYKVIIFSALQAQNEEKELFIKSLGDMSPYVFKELNEYPSCLRKKEVEASIDKLESIVNLVGPYEECFIESDNIATAQWGELFAKKIGAKHFVYFLQENIEETFCKDSLEFLLFKNARKELAGITKTSFDLLFNKYSVKDPKPSHLIAYGADDSLIDCDYSWLKNQMKSGYFRIGIIGRINKLYVKPMTESLALFARKHEDKNFEIIYIGGGQRDEVENNPDVKYICNCFSDIKNVHLIITGSIFPIPKSFISDCDLFLGSAGGACIPYKNNALTIALDGHDGKPIGVMGYTAFDPNYLYRPYGMSVIELGDLLERVIYTDYLDEYKYVPFDASQSDYNKLFFKHIEIINDSTKEKAYFPVEFIRYKSLNDIFEIKVCIKKILQKILGINLYYCLKQYVKRS